MQALFHPIKTAARVGYVIVAWSLIAQVVLQFFHAGVAVLVHPGDWSSHVASGHVISLPVM